MRSRQRFGKSEVSTNEYIEKASVQLKMSSTRRRCRFEVGVNTRRPSNMSCGSGSWLAKLSASRSARSTNLPATICETNLTGTGEKPGPTTNGCRGIGAGRGSSVAMLKLARGGADEGNTGAFAT